MSAKSSRTPKQPVAPPRTAEEIQRTYAEICTKAGNLQFQIALLSSALNDTNKELSKLADEMGERKKLDDATAAAKAAAAAQQTPVQEASNG